jgi:basic membrane lipoprotein Med (substrate-binding protein (PBP1-ABC) superfamily)
MSKKFSVLVALLVVASLMLAAAPAATPEPTPVPQEPAPVEPAPVEPEPVEPAPVEPEPTEPAPVDPPPAEETARVCQVTDAGGIDDRSFNETAWNGLLQAQQDFGVRFSISNHSSKLITNAISTPSWKPIAI